VKSQVEILNGSINFRENILSRDFEH